MCVACGDDSCTDAKAILEVPHKTAGELERVQRPVKERYDVDYVWLRDELGNPIGVLVGVDEFRRLRDGA